MSKERTLLQRLNWLKNYTLQVNKQQPILSFDEALELSEVERKLLVQLTGKLDRLNALTARIKVNIEEIEGRINERRNKENR